MSEKDWDIKCVVCGKKMKYGTEYYDDEDQPYCPDHRSERW